VADPRAICRCGRLAIVESVDVTVAGITWRCCCQHCRKTFDVLAWARPRSAGAPQPAAKPAKPDPKPT